ncbi:hypothetical protein HPB48_016973 [Haemaphysalis longicornis]|uniref:Uncharacterized protein n=1 Tax=Haemaphysalis longicornis TaxID=44386 RepID=A0A9J6H4A2_HAELO|nr:hypothetical protein HPB48_016973 [Haemaphysalis longicornis]
MPGKSKFQTTWLHHDDYKQWIAPDTTSPHRAKCKLCCKTFDVTAMGESALKSHMKSAKHIAAVNITQGRVLDSHLTAVARETGQSATTAPLPSPSLNDACKTHELVTDAEIIWTLKVVTSHMSYRMSSQAGELFQRMFPDSEVAKAFSCGEKKCAYVTCHGLKPFFLSALQREIEQCEVFVVLFDESANDRQVCVENLKELSYVSQRVVCDAVEKAGGVLQIPITKELRIAVSAARQRYGAYLEAQKKQDLDASKQRKKHCIEEELDAMKRKKQKLEATIDDLVASADAYAEKAEAENDVTHIVKSNSLRKTAKDKTAELHSNKVQIQQKRLELP